MNTSIVAVLMVFIGASLDHVEAGVSDTEEQAMREYVEAFIIYRKSPTTGNWKIVEDIKPRLPANYFTATMIVNNYSKATPNLLFSRVTGFSVSNQNEQGIDISNKFAPIIGQAPEAAPIGNHALAGLKTMGLDTTGYSLAHAFFSAKPIDKDATATQQDKEAPADYMFIMGGKA